MADILYNPHFEEFFKNEDRYAILYGGAGSGKSHAEAQKSVERCTHNNERHKILIVRKFRTTLEGSVFTLIRQIIYDFGLEKHVSVNNTKMSFTFSNGNEIIVTGLDDPEKLKSIHGITSIWIEEATEIEEGDFQQLDLRLRGKTDSYKQIVLTFNPVSIDSWIYKVFFESDVDGCFKLWSNYKHNLFLDDQYVKVLESNFEHDPNMKRIYVNGEWGRETTGSEFYSSYDKGKIVKPVGFNDELNIHLSFDFNISPYLPVSMWHIWETDGVYNVGCFDLLTMENPLNSTEDACVEFSVRYPNHDLGVFVYGDASGRARSTTSKKHNYDIIEVVLRPYLRNWSMRVPKRNPLFNKRRDFVNKCIGGGYEDINVIIDPNCELMYVDLENVKTDLAGKKWVKMAKNKAGVPYAKYGHYSDTMDYLLCSAFEDKFVNFGKKIK